MACLAASPPPTASRLSLGPEFDKLAAMNEDESVELDAVAAVARITALEMLVRQMMIVQLRILDKMGEIKLTPTM